MPPPQQTGSEASIHDLSVRLMYNISDKVSRCIPSSALTWEWKSSFKLRELIETKFFLSS